jgi:L-ribulose-5-phosphate 4-epimerase
MIARALREQVFDANLELVRRGLVIESFGNASGIDRARGLVAIKPSGLPYDRLTPASLVVTDLDGRIVDGRLRPSSDLPTHLVLYRAFPGIGGVAHTHSRFATVWAQAGREIPCLGTTHADYYPGPVPLTRPMTPAAIGRAYEAGTGHAIARRFRRLDPSAVTGVLVHGHGPFCWGDTATSAARAAYVLEELAHLAWATMALNPRATGISAALRRKHYTRKHGPGAYYGQAGPRADR